MKVDWQAEWIWCKDRQVVENFYIYARKVVNISEEIIDAKAYCTCSGEYKLYINGHYIGRGPNPCDPRYQYYDEYDIADHLQIGDNVIAVLCYNIGVTTHSKPGGPGGFLFEADLKSSGAKQKIVTDSSWKVTQAYPYAQNSPRIMWSTSFEEIYDERKEAIGWNKPDFDDSSWESAEALGKPPLASWSNLIERQIPKFRTVNVSPVSIKRVGKCIRKPGLSFVNFTSLFSSEEHNIAYALTYVRCADWIEATLRVGCDDGIKAWLNDEKILEYHWHRTWGLKPDSVDVTLIKGWNKLLIKVDQGPGGWGFSCQLTDRKGQKLSDVFYAAHPGRITDKTPWLIIGPFDSITDYERSNIFDDSYPPSYKHCAGFDKIYPPERGINVGRSYKGKGGKEVGWQSFSEESEILDVATLLRWEDKVEGDKEIVIDEEALLKDDERATIIAPISEGGTFLIIDFGREVVGYPRITLEAERGGIMDIGYDEELDENGYIDPMRLGLRYADRVILRGGEQEWIAFNRRAFRYMQLTFRSCPRAVKVKSVSLDFVSYPVEYKGSFECSDERLNKIWDIGRYTLQLCMQDHFEDCPTREHAQYPGDGRVESLENYYAFGDAKLTAKGLWQLVQSQESDGWFHGQYPSGTRHNLPDYCAVWVLWLYDYYLYTGDTSLVEKLYPNLRLLMDWFVRQSNEYGLICDADKKPWWVFIDHAPLDKRGEVTALQCFYHEALRKAALLASAVGDKKQAEIYIERAEKVRGAINDRLWSKEKGVYVDCRAEEGLSKNVSRQTNFLAILFGVADPKNWPRIYSYIYGRADVMIITNPYFNFYVLASLFHTERYEEALELIRSYWGKMLDMEVTTWWECLNPAHDKYPLPRWSLCHAWSGAPTYYLSAEILGVKPTKPGFAGFCVHPKPLDLDWARGIVPSPRGDISVSWANDKERCIFDLAVNIPDNCEVDIIMPSLGYPANEISFDGELAWKDGQIVTPKVRWAEVKEIEAKIHFFTKAPGLHVCDIS